MIAATNSRTMTWSFRPLAGKWINEPVAFGMKGNTKAGFRPLAGKWINEPGRKGPYHRKYEGFPSPCGEVD